MKVKVVDTKAYIDALRELTVQGQEVTIPISGSSMSPFLADKRDRICFRRPDRPLKKGDMVFYQRQSGQYVMHRICRIRPEGYYLIGDAQRQIEGPLSGDCIFAVVTKVWRKGKWIGPADLSWKFFEHVWIRVIPMRRMLIRCYGIFRTCGQRGHKTNGETKE